VIYTEAQAKGNFIALGQTSRSWNGIAAAPNRNIYACVLGDIYIQTTRYRQLYYFRTNFSIVEIYYSIITRNIYLCFRR
jgi:hypothetical protein